MNEPYDNLRYLIDSETIPGKQYLVDLLIPSCDCPNWQCQKAEVKSLGYECKHCPKAFEMLGRSVVASVKAQNPNA